MRKRFAVVNVEVNKEQLIPYELSKNDRLEHK